MPADDHTDLVWPDASDSPRRHVIGILTQPRRHGWLELCMAPWVCKRTWYGYAAPRGAAYGLIDFGRFKIGPVHGVAAISVKRVKSSDFTGRVVRFLTVGPGWSAPSPAMARDLGPLDPRQDIHARGYLLPFRDPATFVRCGEEIGDKEFVAALPVGFKIFDRQAVSCLDGIAKAKNRTLNGLPAATLVFETANETNAPCCAHGLTSFHPDVE